MIIVADIAKYAGARKSEWIMAAMFIHIGYILALPQESFNLSKSFDILRQYADENTWAIIFGAFGLIRTGILILNGVHLKYSPEFRMIMAGLSFIVLSTWVWGIDATGTTSVGAPIYKWLSVLELLNVWQASSDSQLRIRKQSNGS